jgi:hypothetical protein
MKVLIVNYVLITEFPDITCETSYSHAELIVVALVSKYTCIGTIAGNF